MRRRLASLDVPFLLINPYAYGATQVAVAALLVRESFFCIEFRLGEQQVTAFAVPQSELGLKYRHDTNLNLSEVVAELKSRAMRFGATPEAIQLLGLLTSINKTEEAIMAENKLSKGKSAPKAADKDALKDAAKAAPVAGKKGKAAEPAKEEPKKKGGNMDALAKAREAKKNAGPDNRTIKVLKKNHGAREGTYRAAMLDALYASKTVQDFRDSDVDGKKPTAGDLAFAIKDGYVSVK